MYFKKDQNAFVMNIIIQLLWEMYFKNGFSEESLLKLGFFITNLSVVKKKRKLYWTHSQILTTQFCPLTEHRVPKPKNYLRRILFIKETQIIRISDKYPKTSKWKK